MVHAIALVIVLQWANVAGVPEPTIHQAQTEAVRLYRDIGVDLEWSRAGAARDDRSPAIRVVLMAYETGGLRSRADTVMGAAVRTARGTGVAYVFYRRVETEAARYGVPVTAVLACAIAHELGHLLLPDGVHGGHSRDGLMRASWDRSDFHRAEQGLLRFSQTEATRIHSALTPPALFAPSMRGILPFAGTRGSCSLPAPASSEACR